MKDFFRTRYAELCTLVSVIGSFFQTGETIEHDLSTQWRLHSNRRSIVVIALAGACAISLWHYAIRAPDAFPVQSLVSVPSGQSLAEVAATLKEQGVIRSALAFRILVKAKGDDRSLHAGDYMYKEPLDVFSVARSIAVGAFGLEPERIRIPEGATTRSMAIIFRSQLERFNSERFLVLAQPLEGYLFPDTYFFLPNATEETVLLALQQSFQTHIEELSPGLASSTERLHDVVTLASIIEREASDSEDRRKISGVLYNRIAKGMPLQVDVTFIYIMGKNTFQLTREDLRSDNPYNTYVHKGLPPGPIGSPSLDSLDAALHPEKNPYLFYLADNSGVTHFSRTYEEHLAKKRQYLGT